MEKKGKTRRGNCEDARLNTSARGGGLGGGQSRRVVADLRRGEGNKMTNTAQRQPVPATTD